MSAAVVILPRIWATASAECEAVPVSAGKESWRLRLVQAGADGLTPEEADQGMRRPWRESGSESGPESGSESGPESGSESGVQFGVQAGRDARSTLQLVPRAQEAESEEVAESAAGVAGPVPVPVPGGERASIAFYRKYTEGLLTRYQKMSLEAGRVPGLLGREMFRGNVTNYKVQSFEDVVVFVHDMDRCLGRLSRGQEHLIRRIAVQGYTQGETAALLGVPLRTVIRRFNEALDDLTRMFLLRKMLRPLDACNLAS